MSNCIFCKIVKNEIPCDLVFENEKVSAFLDVRPSAPGHTLVVPKEHHEDLLVTPDILLLESMRVIKKVAKAAMEATSAEGFNLIANTLPAAGQVVFHTHFHIIPRFSNDGLKHWPHKEVLKEEQQKIKDAMNKQLSAQPF